MELHTKHGSSIPAHEGDRTNTAIMGITAKGKSIMPDHCELTTALATRAFEMIGEDQFSVSANLSADNTESLRAFGVLESILLMAYQEGRKSALQDAIDVLPVGSIHAAEAIRKII
jgi:hypothetical protein